MVRIRLHRLSGVPRRTVETVGKDDDGRVDQRLPSLSPTDLDLDARYTCPLRELTIMASSSSTLSPNLNARSQTA